MDKYSSIRDCVTCDQTFPLILILYFQNMTHDYSNQNTHEDPRMIAFFDYLVQQEIEGWSSESPNQSSDHTSDNSSRPDSPTSDTEPTHLRTAKPAMNRHRGKNKQLFKRILLEEINF